MMVWAAVKCIVISKAFGVVIYVAMVIAAAVGYWVLKQRR